MQSLRRLLRGAREAVGHSQAELGQAVGVSARTIGRLEACELEVGFDVIAAVRDHYEKIGFRLLPLRDGRSWSLVFPFDVAPFPLPGAEAHGLFHRIPGSVLRAARASLLASQEEVAAKSGLAHTTIRMLERSNPSISATRALKYQNFFNDTEVQITPPDGEVGWRLELRTEKQASVSR